MVLDKSKLISSLGCSSDDKGSDLELEFLYHIKSYGLDKGMVREYKFHPDRRWRFDFAWPSVLVAVEVEGGVWSGGRHGRGSGFIGDCEKYGEAAVLGWRVLRVAGPMVENGTGLDLLIRLFNNLSNKRHPSAKKGARH